MVRATVPGRRIRILHVVNQLDVGGMEKLLVEFARHANRREYDLHFVSLSTRGVLGADIEASGWPVTALETKPGLRPGLVFRIAGLLRSWKPDIVHTHNSKPLMYAGVAARLARVPAVIHTRHGRDCYASRRQVLAFRLSALLANRVVCVSDDSARLTESQGVAGSRVCRLWNGIDLSRFAYRGPQEGGPVVMVARMSPEKDTETLLHAAALLARLHPAFRLEIAGDGVCLPALRETAAALGLNDRVSFLGAVRDVPALLGRASLFVLPSISEGISLTLLEAMARGLPVVTTRVGGNPEVVADNQTGFLVPPRSPEALAERIGFLLSNPDLARQMGLAGRRRVEEHFDVRNMVQQYESLYDRLLPGNRN